ncbi:hypothetical protein [Saccharomonospora iraqiensis]|uniref:hypothetical protein n=1 Tax=Saccharomonospora iraqiensis TaxID=52698 RepID=UPI00047C3AC9|nr:hypothetical protein [Saccharomonospora iraqiensis]
MKTARITSRLAREVVAVATDVDVCAAQWEEDAHVEREEIERLLDEVDRELAEEERTAAVRLDRSFLDARRAWRAVRRGERAVLRALPERWDVAESDGEAA